MYLHSLFGKGSIFTTGTYIHIRVLKFIFSSIENSTPTLSMRVIRRKIAQHGSFSAKTLFLKEYNANANGVTGRKGNLFVASRFEIREKGKVWEVEISQEGVKVLSLSPCISLEGEDCYKYRWEVGRGVDGKKGSLSSYIIFMQSSTSSLSHSREATAVLSSSSHSLSPLHFPFSS
jgi:hypothetical protein